MQGYLRMSVAAVALATLGGVASAQTTIVTRESVELSPAQRTTIYRTVTREPRTVIRRPEFRVKPGDRIQETVEIHEMPRTVVTEVPVVERYRYMVVNDEVLLVDPATSEVVEIIRP
jgi:hypothetical protein